MISEIAKEALAKSVVPIMLGDGLSARVLAMRIFFKYGLHSVICDEKPSAWRHVFGFGGFYKIVKSDDGRLIREELEYIEAVSEGGLLILTPCTPEFSVLVNASSDDIEKRFILASTDNLLDKIYPKD